MLPATCAFQPEAEPCAATDTMTCATRTMMSMPPSTTSPSSPSFPTMTCKASLPVSRLKGTDLISPTAAQPGPMRQSIWEVYVTTELIMVTSRLVESCAVAMPTFMRLALTRAMTLMWMLTAPSATTTMYLLPTVMCGIWI